jgi:hypothetical protein
MHRLILIFTLVSACAVAAACSTTPQARRTTLAATCIQDTGSRIRRPGQCSNEPGRSYSQQDLKSTGQTEVGEALQLLDPSITVHH